MVLRGATSHAKLAGVRVQADGHYLRKRLYGFRCLEGATRGGPFGSKEKFPLRAMITLVSRNIVFRLSLTANIPREKIAHLAFEALAQQHDKTNAQGREYLIDPELVIRESTGPPPGRAESLAWEAAHSIGLVLFRREGCWSD
jgi:hypothetical protein